MEHPQVEESALIMRKSPDFKLIDSVKDNTGRLLLLKVEVFKTMFIIGNVYAPKQ